MWLHKSHLIVIKDVLWCSLMRLRPCHTRSSNVTECCQILYSTEDMNDSSELCRTDRCWHTWPQTHSIDQQVQLLSDVYIPVIPSPRIAFIFTAAWTDISLHPTERDDIQANSINPTARLYFTSINFSKITVLYLPSWYHRSANSHFRCRMEMTSPVRQPGSAKRRKAGWEGNELWRSVLSWIKTHLT